MSKSLRKGGVKKKKCGVFPVRVALHADKWLFLLNGKWLDVFSLISKAPDAHKAALQKSRYKLF